MQTLVKKIDDESIALAVKILNDGGLVAIPTETVYGLAAVGTNPEAVKKIFEVKGRPTDNPLIAHVHKDYDIKKLVKVNYDYVYELKNRFTPGPLTMVMDSLGVVCKEAVCGGDTLAVRIPSHSGCQALLRAIDKPLVAPSANISKHTSPVRAEHVFNDLNGKIPLILDGGKCSGGIESTVLDVTTATPRILRAGLITKEMIENVAGGCEIAMHKEGDRVKSPGVKYGHYRPNCETALFYPEETEKVIALYNESVKQGKTPFIMCSGKEKENFKGLNLLYLGETPEDAAANLYDKLLEGEKKADLIIAVAQPDEKGVNLGVMNRLKKSCGKS
ncbi:MAG: L-threonylcarbamoyladenylate synthase [Clostridia bacterium]|nr:L-threonylcarbamoyladenylate synthase [Clostridia bacterium]